MGREHWSLRIGRSLAQYFVEITLLALVPISIVPFLLADFHPQPWSGILAMIHNPLGILVISLFLASLVGLMLFMVLAVCTFMRVQEEFAKARDVLQATKRGFERD